MFVFSESNFCGAPLPNSLPHFLFPLASRTSLSLSVSSSRTSTRATALLSGLAFRSSENCAKRNTPKSFRHRRRRRQRERKNVCAIRRRWRRRPSPLPSCEVRNEKGMRGFVLSTLPLVSLSRHSDGIRHSGKKHAAMSKKHGGKKNNFLPAAYRHAAEFRGKLTSRHNHAHALGLRGKEEEGGAISITIIFIIISIISIFLGR